MNVAAESSEFIELHWQLKLRLTVDRQHKYI